MTFAGRAAKNKRTMRCYSFVNALPVIGLALAGILALGSSGAAVQTDSETFTMQSALAAAATNNPQAEVFVARLYADGLGVPRDYTKAVEYLRKATTQNYVPALMALGDCYAHGEGVRQSDIEAVHCYYRAAVRGDPAAEYCVGYAYANGKGALRDINLALSWWQKAAEQGQVYAQSALGRFYLYGEYPGDTNHINYTEAAKWLRQAANQNYAPAMGQLGYMYLYAIGLPHDWAQALFWSQKAAALGDAAGQDSLGQMYEDGDAGLPKDLVQAYKWFWLSSQQGCPAGKHDVFEIELHNALTPAQIAEAKRMATLFQAQLLTNSTVDAPKARL